MGDADEPSADRRSPELEEDIQGPFGGSDLHFPSCITSVRSTTTLPYPLPTPPYSKLVEDIRKNNRVREGRSAIIRETVKFFLGLKYWWTSEDYDRIAQLTVREFPDLRDTVHWPGKPYYSKVRLDLSTCARNLRRIAKGQVRRMSSSDSSVVDSPGNGESVNINNNSSSPATNRHAASADQRAPLPPMAHLLRQRFNSPLESAAVPPVSVFSSLAQTYPIAVTSGGMSTSHVAAASLAFTPPSPILPGVSMTPSHFPSREVLQANMRSQRRTMSMSEELPHPLPIPQYPHQIWLAKQEGNLLIHRPLIMRETAQFFLSIKNWWSSSDYDRIADLVVNLFPELVEGGSEEGRDPMRRVRSDLSMYARNLRRRLNKREHDLEARQNALMTSDLPSSSSPPAIPASGSTGYSFKELMAAASLAAESLNSEVNASVSDTSPDKPREAPGSEARRDDPSPSTATSTATTGKAETTLTQGVVVKEEAPDPGKAEEEGEEEEEEEEDEVGPHRILPSHASQPVFAVYPSLSYEDKSPGPLPTGPPLPHPLGENLSLKEPPPLPLGMHCPGTLPYPLPVPPYSSSVMKARETGQVAFHFQRIIRETTLFYLYFKYRWTSREFDRIAEVVMREFPEMGPQKRVKRALSSCARNWRKRLHSTDAQMMMKRAPKVSLSQASMGLAYNPLPPRMELLPPSSLAPHIPMEIGGAAVDTNTAVSLVMSSKSEELESPQAPSSSESSTPAAPAEVGSASAEASMNTSSGIETDLMQSQDGSGKPRKKSGQRSLDTAWLPHNMKCNPTNSMLKSLPNPLPIPKYSFKILKAREMGTVKNCRSLIIRETARFFLYYKKWWSSSDYNRIAELIVHLFPELKNPVLAEGQVCYRRVKSDLSMCARNMRRKEMRNQRSLPQVGVEDFSKYDLQGDEGNSFDSSGHPEGMTLHGDSDLEQESMEVDENSQESDRLSARDATAAQLLRPDAFSSLASSAYMGSVGPHSRLAQSMLAASHYQQQAAVTAAFYHQAAKSPIMADPNAFIRPGGKEVSAAAEALALYRNRVRDLAVGDLQNFSRLTGQDGVLAPEHPPSAAASKESGSHGRGEGKEASASGKYAIGSEGADYRQQREREPGEVVPSSNHAGAAQGGRRDSETSLSQQHSALAKTMHAAEAGDMSAMSGESSEPSSPGTAKKMYVNADHGTKLQRQISRFWKESKFMDAVLDVDGHKLPLHRVVLLAASPHLQSTLAEAELPPQLELSLPAGCSLEAARAFVRYLYDGVLNLDPAILPAMTSIAAMLQIDQLARCCSDFRETYGPKSPVASSAASGTSSSERHAAGIRAGSSTTAPPAHLGPALSGCRPSTLTASQPDGLGSVSTQRKHSVIQGHDPHLRTAPPRTSPSVSSSRGRGEGEGTSHGRQLVDHTSKQRLAAAVTDIIQQRSLGDYSSHRKASSESHATSTAMSAGISGSTEAKSKPTQRLASIESFRHRPSFDLPSSMGSTMPSHSLANGDADGGLRQGAVDMSRQKLASISCFQKRLSADDLHPSSSGAAGISQLKPGSLETDALLSRSDYYQRTADVYSAMDASLSRTSSSTIPSQLASGGIAYGDPRYLAGGGQQFYSHTAMDASKARLITELAQYRLSTEDLAKYGLSTEDISKYRQLLLDSSPYRQYSDGLASQQAMAEESYRMHQGDPSHMLPKDDSPLQIPTSLSAHHQLSGADLSSQLHLSEAEMSRQSLSMVDVHPHYSSAETLQTAALTSHGSAVPSPYLSARDLSQSHGASMEGGQQQASGGVAHQAEQSTHSLASLGLTTHAHLIPGETTHLHFPTSKSGGHVPVTENGKLEEAALQRSAHPGLPSPGGLQSALSQSLLSADMRSEERGALNGSVALTGQHQGRNFEDYASISNPSSVSSAPPPAHQASSTGGEGSHHPPAVGAELGDLEGSFHAEQTSPVIPAHPQPYAAMT